jgi:ribonucleoside-diphosphate reductase alpha chain
VTTSELDNLAAETAAYMNIDHPDYARLAARVSVSNLHKETNPSFAETMKQLYEWVDPETGHHAGFISDELWAVIQVRFEPRLVWYWGW